MAWSRAHLAIGAALVVVGLTGCSAAPAPGLTNDEFAQVIQEKVEFDWRQTGLNDELRPDIGLMVFGEAHDQAAAVRACLNAIGVDGFDVIHGEVLSAVSLNDELGSSVTTDQQITSQQTVAQRAVDIFYCSEKYQIDPALVPLMTTRQLDYIYGYYATSLMPCLRAHGVTVSNPPSRAEFAPPGQHALTWNPYLTADSLAGELVSACPAMPRGYEDAFDVYRETAQ
jgi:hypothetical protein